MKSALESYIKHTFEEFIFFFAIFEKILKTIMTYFYIWQNPNENKKRFFLSTVHTDTELSIF